MQIDFYVLSAQANDSVPGTACRLAEKAWEQGLSVYIHLPDPQDAAPLDSLLWTFKQDSFIPHEVLAGGTRTAEAPIVIGTVAPEGRRDLLINLAQQAPVSLGAFDRMIEIIPDDEGLRTQGRARYQAYRRQGHELRTFKL